MNGLLVNVDRVALWALWTGLTIAAVMAAIMIAGRLAVLYHERLVRRLRGSMGPAGRAALESCAARADQAGVLARQVLWEVEAGV